MLNVDVKSKGGGDNNGDDSKVGSAISGAPAFHVLSPLPSQSSAASWGEEKRCRSGEEGTSKDLEHRCKFLSSFPLSDCPTRTIAVELAVVFTVIIAVRVQFSVSLDTSNRTRGAHQ